ncbi:MAG TPA: hypothetical protein VHG08_03160 [Longimicrobium sp.]|nr:hypothetical protein [Longimicrobium sp.]
MPRDLLLVLAILVLFPIFFVGLWLFVATILSAAGGWGTLAARYPAPPGAVGQAYGNSSGFLRRWGLPVNYNYILLVRVGESGIGLETHFPFRFKHPPLFIPWQAVRECRRFSLLFFSGAEIRLHESDVRIAIIGRAGSAILEQCSRLHRQ